MSQRDTSHLAERIRALDPFAGAPYAHAHASAMVERITSAEPARRRRRRLAVVLTPVTALAAAGLAAGGLLATAGTAAPSLSAIRILGADGHAPSQKGELGFSLPAPVYDATPMADRYFSNGLSMVMQTASGASDATYLFQLASELPSHATALPAFQVFAPARPTRVLAASAARLGVQGAVTRFSPSAWRLADPARRGDVTGLVKLASGLYYLEYARRDLHRALPCAAGGAGPADADPRAMAATVTELLDALGVHYRLSSPTFETSWWRTPRTTCTGMVLRDATILVQGLATDQVVRAVFDPSGRLVAASVPVFSVGHAVAYPVVSPATAAAALVQSTSNLGALEHRAEGQSHRRSTGVPQNLVIVELRASSSGLRAFATPSGATWLLPVYALSGDGYAGVVASSTSWSGDVLATTTRYVRLVGRGGNQAHVFDVRPSAVP